MLRSHGTHKKSHLLPSSQQRPSQTRQMENHLPTYPQARSHISPISPAQGGPPASKQPRGVWEGRGGTGDVLLVRMLSLSQGLSQCHLKATGWHGAGCEQPPLGYGHVAELPVTAGQEAPAPLVTCSKIPWADRGNKRIP